MIAELNNYPETSDETALHDRLEAVSRQIDSARDRLSKVQRWHDQHALTAKELRARYSAVRAKIDHDVDDEEAHGHHVGALEKSVRQWLHEIEH